VATEEDRPSEGEDMSERYAWTYDGMEPDENGCWVPFDDEPDEAEATAQGEPVDAFLATLQLLRDSKHVSMDAQSVLIGAACELARRVGGR
jgi:hypothetical protein